MNARPYGDIIAANIRAARARADLGQAMVAERMRTLGYSAWFHQTVGNVERAKRRVAAEEIFGLALALETTVGNLLSPADELAIRLPSGSEVAAGSVLSSIEGRNDGAVRWRGADIAERSA